MGRVEPRVALELVVDVGLDIFAPLTRGGGSILVQISPATHVTAVSLLERGALRAAYAEAYLSGIARHVADRELGVIARRLKWSPEQLRIRSIPGEMGPGNVLALTLEYEHVTEVFTSFGALGRSAESVGEQAAKETRDYLSQPAPVGPHLADQLLLPMALGGLTSFATCAPTPHFLSNANVIAVFTGKRLVARADGDRYVVCA